MNKTLYSKIKWACNRIPPGTFNTRGCYEISGMVDVYRATYDIKTGGYHLRIVNSYGSVETITEEELFNICNPMLRGYVTKEGLSRLFEEKVEHVKYLLTNFMREVSA